MRRLLALFALVAMTATAAFALHWYSEALQDRLVGAVIYWTLRNPQLRRYEVLTGYQMPRSLQRFGIMWEFTN